MAYDNDTIVEATSLAHVTSIATTPPWDPNALYSHPRLPLVLYIARVPGSRDVFLTPIKPREKVVTAEDVQSSLYFVHVNCPEDFDHPGRRPSSVDTDASSLLASPRDRKPVLPVRPSAPSTPRYPTTDGLSGQQRTSLIARKPIGKQRNAEPPVLPSRPLPLPPPDEEPYNFSLHGHNVHLLRQRDHSDENNPYQRLYEPPPKPLDPELRPEPGSLTLIRRDPSSNEQWDVASIHDPPVHEVSSTALLNANAGTRTKRGGVPLYLDITNPAYAQFVGSNRPNSRTSAASSSSSDSEIPPVGIFRRRLYMPGSKYGEHQYSQQSRLSVVDSTNSNDNVPLRKSGRHSVDMSTTSSAPRADRRSKSYTFKSPWDGRCEFSTGATGRSLKCKHYLSNDHGRDVSELRFNLPTKPSRTAAVLSEKRASYLHRLHGRGEDGEDAPTYVFGEDGKLDLTLGQERAGGGFGGKQAKLGKLIIEPEGLKMLDLLVAANLGLWWRAYDKL